MIRALKNGTIGCPYCNGFKVRREDSAGAKAPELIKEWASSNESTLYEYAPNSKYLATWCCPDCGTKWKAPINVRVQGYGKCPTCYGNKTFKERYPELEKFYAKDNTLPYEDAIVSDYTPRNWICEKGHEFTASFYKIHDQGFRCPYCENKKALKGYNDFEHLYPVLAQDYDEEKNGNKASEVVVSYRNVYFKCKNGHSFVRPIIRHVELNGQCPICSGTVLKKGSNDLATIYPAVILFWDYEKNEKRPDQVLATLDNSYHFVCSNGHHFKCTLRELVENDFHCPVCEGKRVDPEKTSLQALNPELASEFSVNNKSTASQIAFDTSRKVLWTCPTCGEDYLYPVNERKIGDNSCPYCNHTKLKSGVNDLTITNPQLASEFSPRNDKKANEVGEWQVYEVYWICSKCGTEYYAKIRDRSVEDASCPACAGKRVQAGFNSFADEHPDIAKDWSPDNDKKPTEVLSNSSYIAEWICPTCGYTYKATIKDRVANDNLCPACAGKKAQPGFNSFADEHPDIAKDWSTDNDKKPTEVLSNSSYIAEWICPTCGYTYKASVRDRVASGDLCPACAGKKAQAGFNSLLDIYPEVQDEWAENENTLLGIFPDEILPTSTARVWWECKDCGRKYLLSVNMWVEKHIRGMTSCTYCSGLRMRETHILL
jgi:rubrerythrin